MDKKYKFQVNKVIEKAKNDERVIAVALFGSSLNKNKKNFNPKDIDLCVFLDKKYKNKEMSKKRLEFLRENGNEIDIQVFQQLPVYIRIRVLKEGKFLLTKDSDKIYEIAFNTLKEFGFYKKIYDTYLREVGK